MMKFWFNRTVSALALGLIVSAPVAAHFQEIIPSKDVLDNGGSVTVDMAFTHPFEGGPVMNMKLPARVGVLSNGQQTDLLNTLKEKKHGDASTWSFEYDLVEPGASIFYVTPQPYWEPAENLYIVHHAKVVVDNYASGQGWDEMVGLPVEIQPLTRPTGLWAGNIFSAVVTKEGKPVPFAEIYVAYVNEQGINAPSDAHPLQVLKADANGTFHYAMPFEGWWGFAALVESDELMISPDKNEVPVEEGASIWVHVAAGK